MPQMRVEAAFALRQLAPHKDGRLRDEIALQQALMAVAGRTGFFRQAAIDVGHRVAKQPAVAARIEMSASSRQHIRREVIRIGPQKSEHIANRDTDANKEDTRESAAQVFNEAVRALQR